MKKLALVAALSAGLAAPALAQDGGLNMGSLAANGPLIAAGTVFLTIVVVGANADSTTTTTTLVRN